MGMIIFDISNMFHRVLHLDQIAIKTRPNWNLWHYMVFTNMYDYVLQVSADYSDKYEVVIATDDHSGYWRQDIYPAYKGDRVKARAKTELDWSIINAEFEKFIVLAKKYLPWKILTVPKCEADDIIYSLTTFYSGNIFIHSGDSDYVQLVDDNVRLFSPNKQEYLELPGVIKISNADVWIDSKETYIKYAVLTGQGGKDNVFNVATPSDWDTNKRKPGFGVVAAKKVIEAHNDLELWAATEDKLANYLRNLTLIDMRETPKHIVEAVTAAYNNYNSTPDLDMYLDNYGWPSLSEYSARENMKEILGLVSGNQALIGNTQEETYNDFTI